MAKVMAAAAAVIVGRPPMTGAQKRLSKEIKAAFLKGEKTLAGLEARVVEIDGALAGIETLRAERKVPAAVLNKGEKALIDERKALRNVIRSAKMFGQKRGVEKKEAAKPVTVEDALAQIKAALAASGAQGASA
jgi:hypothetical protein